MSDIAVLAGAIESRQPPILALEEKMGYNPIRCMKEYVDVAQLHRRSRCIVNKRQAQVNYINTKESAKQFNNYGGCNSAATTKST